MRKFLAIVAVLAMLFALAIPAFAAEGPSSENASGSGTGTSPQTGFDTTVWTAMGGLLLAAGVCFVCAGKKVTE